MTAGGGGSGRTKAIPEDSGSITGFVVYTGPAGEEVTINMNADPVCASAHSGVVTARSIVTNADGRVKNVVVTIAKGLEEYVLPLPEEPPMLDQLGCLYAPSAIVVKPGTLRISNSDKTLHNVHSLSKTNKSFNSAMPAGSAPLSRAFDKEEVVPVKCDVHAWMKAYIIVANTIGDVTKDDGTFTLMGIPPGEYTIKTWHETLAPTTMQVTVKPSEATNVELALTKE